MPDGAPHFDETEVPVDGITYKLRELSSGEYDDALQIASKADGDVDLVVMVKLMLVKSLTEPKLTDVQIGALPYKTARVLKRAVSDLHWKAEQDELIETPSEGEPKNP